MQSAIYDKKKLVLQKKWLHRDIVERVANACYNSGTSVRRCQVNCIANITPWNRYQLSTNCYQLTTKPR